MQGRSLYEQPELAFLRIKIMLLLVPAVIVAIRLIFIYYYPLHGEKLAEMQEKLAKLHAKKKAAYYAKFGVAQEMKEQPERTNNDF